MPATCVGVNEEHFILISRELVYQPETCLWCKAMRQVLLPLRAGSVVVY